MDDLEPLDPVYVADILSRLPFVTIDGVINARDLGFYPSETSPGQITRPKLIYRSAELSGIRRRQLKALNITRVFDLRSDVEIRKYNSPQPEIDGVEVLHTPVFQKEDYSPEMMAKYTISALAGINDTTIAEDYALTRVGREPAREMIMARLSKEPLFASNNEAALNMFTCRHETMTAFLSLLRDKYGGPEDYIKNYCHLTDEDVRTIRKNILCSGTSHL
ncbi:hypothetical protein H0H93_006730 [Arthromyces matolae]|nr:hypothetical protein H0H93_006730 [Arthromyces matolae]